MSLEANKALVRRFYGEVINEKDLTRIEAQLPQYIAPDYLDHNSTETARGPEAYLQHLKALRRTFPDFQLQVLDVVAEGDLVVCRVSGSGTHMGEFLGLRPTGRRVQVHGMNFDRVQNGRIAEHWGEADTFGMLLEMGMEPPPGLRR